MDGLSAATTVIAAVEISVKVISLCSQYANAVAGAREDILRLDLQINGLKSTLQHARAIIEAPEGASLSASRDLTDQIQECQATLQKLRDKLEANIAPMAKRRFFLRALKWPFSREELEATTVTIERFQRRIMDGLQVDQTTLLLNIETKLDNLSPPTPTYEEDISVAQKPHNIVPFPRDLEFVARPAIQHHILEQFAGPGSRIALVGMGGFGKSQIAIDFAHDVLDQHPEMSVFWVHGSTKAAFEESYRSIADKLALPRRHDPKINILTLVSNWLQRDDIAPWLMILDNADNLNVLFEQGQESSLASYLPKTSNGKILITSRNLNVAERLTGNHKSIIQIPKMGNMEGLFLLRSKLGSAYEEHTATELVSMLDFIPLAVSQAAAYINRRHISIEAYMERFKNSEERRMSLLKHDAGDIRRHESASNSVAMAWQVTLEQILEESPAAIDLLSLMSCFQPQNIPRYLLSKYMESLGGDKGVTTGSRTLEDDVDVLLAYSLINASAESEFYDMHSLVQTCTRAWLQQLGNMAHWERLFLHLISEHFPSGQFETWRECQILLPHVEMLLETQPVQETDVFDWALLLTNASWYMAEMGDYRKALVLAQKSVEVRTKLLGIDHLLVLDSMANVASIYRKQGRLGEAKEVHQRVMEARLLKLGADHPSTLDSMANLASTYKKQGQLRKAEELHAQVMVSRKMQLGADHPSTLNSMANLASIYRKRGRLTNAEELLLQVLETRKAKLGADHPSTLNSMANLASTYKKQGQLEKAEELFKQVIDARKTRLGASHPSTLTSLVSLAWIWHSQGNLADAVSLMKNCADARQRVLGIDHPDTVASLATLAEWTR